MWQHSARTFSGIMSLYDAEMTSINHMKRLHPMTMVVTLYTSVLNKSEP